MSEPTMHDSPLARWALRLCALWLAAGALAKLFFGTPALLPEVVRGLTPLSLDLTYTLVIGVELGLVGLAFLRPRQAWPPLVAVFAFFEFVLATQLAAGEESCGCFGGGLKVSPALMMAVDSALLLFLLATKPWAALKRPGAGLGLVLLVLALSFALPASWIRVRQSEGPVAPPADPNGKSPPVKAPDWLTLDPAKWVGQGVYDIAELTKWVAAEKLPSDGKVVLWRQGCTHCAKHLRELAHGDKGEEPILLVQIQDDEQDSRAVDAMPSGAHVTTAEFPKGMQVVLETPWEIRVAAGTVTTVLDPKTLDPDEH
jgi:hypothetical protein